MYDLRDRIPCEVLGYIDQGTGMNDMRTSIRNLGMIIIACMTAPTWAQGFKHTHSEPRSIQNGPQAYFESKVIDLGDVPQHERIVGSVMVENHGNADLEIRNLSATCGCTVLELDESQRIVPPNGKQEITVFFNTEERQGRQRKLVSVLTNDPEYPVTELIVKSNVFASFQVLPAQFVALIDARPGEQIETLSVFPTADGATLDGLEIEVPGRILEYAMESIVNDEGVAGIGVTFSVADEVELGPIDTELAFTGTVNGKAQTVVARVKGKIVGPIEVRPTMVESIHPTPRGRQFAPVTLRPADGKPFEIISIDAGEYLDASQSTGKVPGDIDITLRLKENAPDGPTANTVKVYTDQPDMPIVQIPFFIDVLPRCRVNPPIVVFDARALAEPRRIRLQSDIVSTLEIESASCDNPHISVEVVEPSATHPKVRFIELNWADGNAPSQDASATLTVETNVAGSETIDVPIQFRIIK